MDFAHFWISWHKINAIEALKRMFSNVLTGEKMEAKMKVIMKILVSISCGV